MHSLSLPLAESVHTASTAVAIDKDKHSQQAVKWAVDHLVTGNLTIALIHVRSKAHHNPELTPEQQEFETQQIFLPYRGFCARKGVQLIEVVLDDNDISKALVDYISANVIQSIVLGSSNRSAIAKKFRNHDIGGHVTKFAPEYCAVYVISKGKPLTIRTAKGPAPNTPVPPRQPSPLLPYFNGDHDDAVKTPFTRSSYRASGSLPLADTRPSEKCTDHGRPPSRERRPLYGARAVPPGTFDGMDYCSFRQPENSSARSSFSEDLDLQGGTGSRQSLDLDYLEFSSTSPGSPKGPHSSASSSHQELQAEMRRLKLELKQTMDMYSNACREAISAKQKTKELNQWKVEEARKFEEVRQAEEAALAVAKMEKAKCKAALETAEAAQRIAKLEAKKRLNAEMEAKRDAEERMRALDTLAQNDFRYRKYSIEDIEIATNYFSEDLKIGEGGYGPVFRASLDHTPVAIKVLRPDAAQGKRQFQQEVEILSCLRHPNMVLLLGACPEYGCLVYEYMDNGSLEDRLFRRGNTHPIPWRVRFKIAAEIATALLFMHQTRPEPLVHRDLKPANVLLDRNYVSKISDVGLARLVPPSVADNVTQYRMTSAAGTLCYIDPEYQQTGMLGVKSDIYSFGVMLLQILTARPPMALSHHVQGAVSKGAHSGFEEILDPAIGDWPVEEALSCARIALGCVELRRKDRPDLATEVLPELNRLRNLAGPI